MFEKDYTPSKDMELRDRAYQMIPEAPDLSVEMDEVIRGEMSISEFVERTPGRKVGLEAFKLDREAASIIPNIYSDYIAVSYDSPNRKVTYNTLVVEKLLALAQTDEGWNKIATAPLQHCPYVTPDTVVAYLPQLMSVVRYSVEQGLAKTEWMYSQVASEGDVSNVRDRLTMFQPKINEQNNVLSKISGLLDNYTNINSVGETFTREQFIETLTRYKDGVAPYVASQDESMLVMLQLTSGVIYKGYRILSMVSEDKDNSDVVSMLSTAAKYVEDCSKAVGFVAMISGRLNEFVNHINKAVG